MSDKPVIVYGASGYTGRLICEYLREYNLPFVAAGRNKDKVQSIVEKIPGVGDVLHDVVEVEHTVEALTELFAGASVVCNTVGPFSTHGPEVVEACLAAGAHYIDTTGEQDWLITCEDAVRVRRLPMQGCCSPRASRRCTPPARSRPSSAWKSPASTPSTSRSSGAAARPLHHLTILVNAALAGAYYLEQNQ